MLKQTMKLKSNIYLNIINSGIYISKTQNLLFVKNHIFTFCSPLCNDLSETMHLCCLKLYCIFFLLEIMLHLLSTWNYIASTFYLANCLKNAAVYSMLMHSSRHEMSHWLAFRTRRDHFALILTTRVCKLHALKAYQQKCDPFQSVGMIYH